MMEIPSKYSFKETENRWYAFWESKGYFYSQPDNRKNPFTIVIPPPNITGCLHMGHALNNVLQDVLIRWKRMQGYNAMWLPGTDHGGIATQNVVEKQSLEQGIKRQNLGREKFLSRMWKWRQETGDIILNQLKKLGCSCDWQRTIFTMDPQYQTSVLTAFVKLYQEGLIYRGEYIINWCPHCETALANIEVEYEPMEGKLWYINYPIRKSKVQSPKSEVKTLDIGQPRPRRGEAEGGRTLNHITVATTRPETMLGDTGVAVHPQDKKYKSLVGKSVILPLMNREIPIIADEFVDPEFGTGAVKVTPGHDPNDFEIGNRHKLPIIKIIDEKGKMTRSAGKYQGMERYQCRENLLKDLHQQGYLVKEEPYSYPVGHCYRCQTIVEPLVSEQWWLKTKNMAKEAIKVVAENKIRFVPAAWKKPYLEWLENLHDWCISRQIWWGHRIPVWYCPNGVQSPKSKVQSLATADIGHRTLDRNACPPIVSIERPQKCPHCGSTNLIQDSDVLDTWFSSALWPFAALGWPAKQISDIRCQMTGKTEHQTLDIEHRTSDLEYYYPTSVLVTGHEILYLWVARMVMLGLKFQNDIPFRKVYIHGIVRDKKGKKMSKSLGNVIDPLEITKKYGTDALRFTLVQNGVLGRDLQLSEENFVMARNFANKIWNASRFVLLNLKGFDASRFTPHASRELSDRWILSEYSRIVKSVTAQYEEYNLSEAARLLYNFFWRKYCDWYLELIKPRVSNQQSAISNQQSRWAAQSVMVYVLEGVLKLLHPVMPFITEEIYQKPPIINYQSAISNQQSAIKSIMVTPWPESNKKFIDETAEEKMELIIELISSIRNIRAEFQIPLNKKTEIAIKVKSKTTANVLTENLSHISNLGRCSVFRIGREVVPPASSVVDVVKDTEIYVKLPGEINLEKEKSRLKKKIERIEVQLQHLEDKLANKEFIAKAPADIITKAKIASGELQQQREKLNRYLSSLSF